MATIEIQALSAMPQSAIADRNQEAPDFIMADVVAQILAEELQQAPVANMAASIVRADISQPIIQAPAAKMLPNLDTPAKNPTPPSTPKPVVTAPALPKTSATAASLFDTLPSRENTPDAEIIQDTDAPQAEIIKEVTKEVPEPTIEPVELTIEPVTPLTPKSIGKVKIEHPKSFNTLKRAHSATPTPNPSIKRMKLENSNLEKRVAEKKKALAEKRANRIKAQGKASEAQQKAASAETRRQEALENMLEEMENEILEEERLADEAEEQFVASEAAMGEFAVDITEAMAF